jgi:dTDP-4-dehydrorhamnose reductase
MRVLIPGGSGMLGHQLFKQLSETHDARVTLRGELSEYLAFGLFNEKNSYSRIELGSVEPLARVVKDFRPEVIVNAAGFVKQKAEIKDSISRLEINSLLPHRLALLCEQTSSRLIHMSTDGVFSGKKGGYRESDPSDAEDLYSRSKFLGEVHEPHCLTLRTSIIGRELMHKTGLLEWFLSQRGKIRGFRRAIYSGFTTIEMTRLIERIISRHVGLSGLWHVASNPISKYDLLCMLKDKLGREDVKIEPDDTYVCDRSLDATRFLKETDYKPPAWSAMLDELAEQIRHREG